MSRLCPTGTRTALRDRQRVDTLGGMNRVRALTLLVAGVLAGFVLTSCGGSGTDVDTSIADPTAVVSQVESGATVIDVRTPEEYASGHVTDALNIDVSSGSFEDQVKELDPAGEYVVYCRSGNRSQVAVAAMSQAGINGIYELESGIVGWTDAGQPVVS